MVINFSRKDSFNKDALLIYVLPTLAVLLAMIVITFWAWTTTKQNYTNNRNRVVTENVNKLQALFTGRLRSYEEILRGGTGLFEGQNAVSKQDWKNFINAYDVQTRYPGIDLIGYIAMVKADAVADYTADQRVQNTPSFTIYPAGERLLYGPVTYVEPQSDINNENIGFDMLSEPTRQSAMQQAATKNRAVITGKISPLPGTTTKNVPMFIMYFPVYEKQCAEQSTQRKTCTVTGYTYGAFRVDNFVSGALGANASETTFSLYDGQAPSPDSQLYQTATYRAGAESTNTVFTLFSRNWTLSLQPAESDFSPRIADRPLFVLLAGLLLSVIVTVVVFMILLQRTRSLRHSKDQEVLQVKDDLLALAAHQLRTPATAVKQYTLMALEGYGGDLNPDQVKLITKAYENNQRQLQTVNEMLYVANVDAGNLRMRFNEVDIVQIVREIIDEQQLQIKEKMHTIHKHLPSTPLHYPIDELYFRMAVSNVISNAIKYTPQEGKIYIRVSVNNKSIILQVKDSGVGISKKQMPDLFKKFTRLENSLTANTIGSGLGLYLSKKIIELHHGQIKVVSKVNAGTEFTILLPRRRYVKKNLA